MSAKLLRTLATAGTCGFFALVLGALTVVVVIPRAVGGAALTVLTGSMSPSIGAGSLVVVQPVDPGTLGVGDVITYQEAPGRSAYITHRIQAVHAETDPVTLTTKGDANATADSSPVPVTAVRGRVILSVPHLGAVKNAIGTSGAGVLVLMMGLSAYAAGQLLAALRERRPETRATSVDPVPLRPQMTLQLLVAKLASEEFHPLTPAVVASLLRMDLVDEAETEFTLALAREPEQLNLLEDLLLPFHPLRLVRSDVVTVDACRELLASSHHPVTAPHADAAA